MLKLGEVEKAFNRSFNTVNGKHCCNSITSTDFSLTVFDKFQYRKR